MKFKISEGIMDLISKSELCEHLAIELAREQARNEKLTKAAEGMKKLITQKHYALMLAEAELENIQRTRDIDAAVLKTCKPNLRVIK